MDDANKRDVRTLGRRELLTQAALVGAGLAIAPWARANAPTRIRMKTRKLGSLEVSALGAGCMSISANYGPPADRGQGIRVIRAVQTEYSFMTRDPEQNGVLETCEALGIGFVPWGPVGMGFLTGKLDARSTLDPKTDLRAEFSRFTPENLAANRPVVDLLARFAAKKGATPAQLALAWLLAQKPWIVPIPGTRNPDHLAENLGAVDLQLTSAELREMEVAFSKVTVHGGRMGEKYLRDVDQTQ